MVCVAALQFALSTDVDDNLATCLRMIDKAARQHTPRLMVLPGCANHPLAHDDAEHAARVAVTLDGPFLRAIAAAAADHESLIALRVSLRDESGQLSLAGLLYDERGQLAARADACVLPGAARDTFVRAAEGARVAATRHARVGLCLGAEAAFMDGPRSLALHGAQLLAVSAGACEGDEAAHLAARAAENRIFAVAASPLGGSCIVAPDGRVLAAAESSDEAIVAAEIEPQQADDKLRADGTHLFALRRPDLYRSLSGRARPGEAGEQAVLSVALLAPPQADSVDATLAVFAESLVQLAGQGVELVVLPELFYLPGGKVEFPAPAADLFVTVVRRLAEACAGSPMHVVTSAVERAGAELFHMGLVIGARGVVARQPQLHVPLRQAWATAGRRLDTFRLPWGRLAVAVGEDLCMPELIKVHALAGAQVVAAPFAASETWELSLGVEARAADNGLTVAAATYVDRGFGASILKSGAVSVELEPSASLLRAEVALQAPSASVHEAPWLASDLTRRGLGVPEQRRTELVDEPQPVGEPEPAANVEGESDVADAESAAGEAALAGEASVAGEPAAADEASVAGEPAAEPDSDDAGES
jgi:predicted amidohydrolase